GIEDTLLPAGFAADPADRLRRGAIGFSGDERPSAVPLRRTAALLRNWGALLNTLRLASAPRAAAGKLPPGVSAVPLVSGAGPVVSVTNEGPSTFGDDLKITDAAGHTATIPGVSVPPGESLWLPLGVSLGQSGLCKECSNFSAAENVVYSTAEILSIEF